MADLGSRLLAAIDAYVVVTYRRFYGTGGGATDDDVEAAYRELLDARRAVDHPPDSLDAAWAEAEAALPEGCILKLEHDPSITDLPAAADAIEYAEWAIAHVDAESPAAALRALAAKLRERAG